MGIVVYSTAAAYVGTCRTIKAKIAAINEIQDALLTQALINIEKGMDVSQYSLNDGQTIVSTSYKSATEIHAAYNEYEKIKQMYLNRLSGRMMRLVDHKSLNMYGNGCC